MAMNPNVPATGTRAEHLLACGRSVEQVWAELEAGQISAHAADCPHCTTARASLEQLAQATALLVDEPVEPPTGLLDKIMAADGAGDPARAAVNMAAMNALTTALDGLPPGQRACWLLREVHGRSYEEISHAVGPRSRRCGDGSRGHGSSWRR